MDIAFGLIIGVGLSAACGFRLFVPFLAMGLAHRAGQLSLADGFAWIGTTPAIAAFGTATVLEILAYYIPWIDNLLDSVSTPSAAIAGTLLAASQLGEASPLVQWSLAAIAGGGTSLTIQTGTAAARVVSTGTTGGMGNFVIATLEWVTAILLAILAIVVPLFCLVLIVAVLWKMLSFISQSRKIETAPTQI